MNVDIFFLFFVCVLLNVCVCMCKFMKKISLEDMKYLIRSCNIFGIFFIMDRKSLLFWTWCMKRFIHAKDFCFVKSLRDYYSWIYIYVYIFFNLREK